MKGAQGYPSRWEASSYWTGCPEMGGAARRGGPLPGAARLSLPQNSLGEGPALLSAIACYGSPHPHSRTLALPHSRTLALSHSRTLALSHSRTLALPHFRTS